MQCVHVNTFYVRGCFCVCEPADASQAFSTCNKKTQQAASRVSASAIRWPAPHLMATLLSTSPQTSWKVMTLLDISIIVFKGGTSMEALRGE